MITIANPFSEISQHHGKIFLLGDEIVVPSMGSITQTEQRAARQTLFRVRYGMVLDHVQ